MSTGPTSANRSRSWPEAAHFNEAVQNLATTMSDRELQGGEPELSPLGVPMPYAGNFADVYKVHCPQSGNTWAVKFFKREVRDLRERYRAISEQLIIAQLPFMTEFRYLDEGVRIGGAWYPLVKMRWIEGQSLSRFVAQSLFQPKLLDQLFELWVKLAARLRGAGIAHADLQHGNVVLVPHGDQGRLLLKLIDYDGMFVPALAGQPSSELGHANYQHPQREATRAYHAELDRFSHLAICCALRCLSVGGLPLWERFNTDDNVLFTARDFADPGGSNLFRELWTFRNRDAHALVGHLALATQSPLEQTPLLDELVRDAEVRPLTADEQRQVQELLGREAVAPTPARHNTEPVATTVESLPLAKLAPTPPAAAAPVAAIAAPPVAAASPAGEIVDAELVPPRSLLSLAVLPLVLLDRLLRFLAGAENALLHNFFRVVATAAVVGIAPAVYYGSGLWSDKPALTSPGLHPIASLPDVTPEPEENPPEPDPKSEPEPPPVNPFVVETEPTVTPGPIPVPSPTPKPKPNPPPQIGPTPLNTTRRRPFEELERSSGGLALLKLPPLPADTPVEPALLAQVHVDRPQDLEIKLLGTSEVFSLARRVDLENNDDALSPGKLRSWRVTRSRSEAGALLAAKEYVGEFSLDADQKLTFAWGSSSVVKNLGALRYCLLELKAPTESVVCALTAPLEGALPKWSFNETTGIATLPLAEIDAATLPPVDRLRVDLSLGAGQRVGPNPFPPELRKETSAAGSEVNSSSPRFAFSGLLEVKAALSYDPQSAGSGRLVFAPEFIKKVYKRDGAVDEPTPASSSRLTRLRLECDTEIKRLTAGRDSKKRLADVERWNQQLALAQEKYFLAEEQMANSTNPSTSMLKKLDSLNREVEKFQNLLDKRAQEDQESSDLQSFAEDNRNRCDQALQTLAQLEQSTLSLRLFYEVDVNSTRRQVDILRTTPTKSAPPGKTKGRRGI